MTFRLSGAVRRLPSSLAPAAAWTTLFAAALCAPAHAQDSRTVREPVVPPSCAVLKAAPASAQRDDGVRIQAAIDRCAPGQAVHLAPNGLDADFVSGPLVLRDGVTLYVDAGVTLKASTNPMLFDRGAGACGTIDKAGKGCKPFITMDGIKDAGIMGEGVIDGQGGQPIDGKTETWWQIARRAQKEMARQNVPRMIQIDKSRDITLYRITLRNSTNFHVAMSRVDGFTAWGIKIDTPKDARNTDGIDPGASRNVTIAYSHIRTGDDNVAIKAGSGISENISILHNRFYHGHGMSIGSETNGGVRNVLVEDLDMDGTTSGLRIKSNDRRGGVVQNIVYRDVCLRDVRWPLYIDTQYEPSQGSGQSYPSYAGIRMENVHSVTPGERVIFEGYSDNYPLQLTLKDVVVDGNPNVRVKFAKLTGRLNAPDARAPDCSKRFAAFPVAQGSLANEAWVADLGDGRYKNPVLHADYSDPDAIRVGDTYYMTSSSFNSAPGLPLLQSKDMVNWELVGHALPRLIPAERYTVPRLGGGVWAPCLRWHDGKFWIFYPDPDLGIFVTTATAFTGPWSTPQLLLPGKGIIDPTPLSDDDGKAWLLHGWAKSRSGINNLLTLRSMAPDASRLLDSEGQTVIDGNKLPNYRTLEGPKFYKKNGYYYVFAPAGGVEEGWQSVFRARRIQGPYEVRIVMDQGKSSVNGPHQGAWVRAQDGSDWFLHFQDKGVYGRVVHLQPMRWADDWPVIGDDGPVPGTGQPVPAYRKPVAGGPLRVPPTSDEFDGPTLGLQWQWNANSQPGWYSLTDKPGSLRLRTVAAPEALEDLRAAPSLLTQKLPAPEFVVNTRVQLNSAQDGDRAGLVVNALQYAWLALRKSGNATQLVYTTCAPAKKCKESSVVVLEPAPSALYLRMSMGDGGIARFAYSLDNVRFIAAAEPFTVSKGHWVGAQVGLFSVGTGASGSSLDADYFRVTAH